MKLFTIGLVAVLAGTALHALPHAAHADDTVIRSAGPERIATSVAASRDHRDRASDALLANATTFPDALSATALAAGLDAPLLLTQKADLPTPVEHELQRLGVETVWLLGGPEAISVDVERLLEELGYEVERIGGRDRYQTAKRIAVAAGPSPTGEVVLALGNHPEPERAWPDAVASGALAASPDRLPTLLTAHDHLPEPTREALAELAPDRVLLVGGVAAISESVQAEVAALGYEVERLAGRSRYGTSIELAANALERAQQQESPVVFATGENFPDALAAGSLAGSLEAPLVLVPSGRLDPGVDAFLRAHADRWTFGIVVGGEAAASAFVAEELRAALNDAPAPAPPPDADPDPEVVVGVFEGVASWYGARFHGSRTASGEIFNMYDFTAAHRTLPFGTRLRVTNPANGHEVVVRINDRGPFTGGRVLDLSRAAAEQLDMISAGTAHVRAEILAD